MALTDNLVAYYKLDESSGNASDSVASYDLTNVNTVGYATGKINNGADFGDANTDKVLTAGSNLGIDGGNITIAAWVYRESSDFMFPITQGNSNSKVRYRIKYESGWKAVREGSSEQQTTAQAADINTWYYLVLTYDGTNLKLYVNAGTPESIATSGNGSLTTKDQFRIGADTNNGTGAAQFFYDGMVDEVGIWSRALTSDEVTALYNGGSGLTYPFTTTNIKKFNGVAYANIKKINGLAIANIKKINGLV